MLFGNYKSTTSLGNSDLFHAVISLTGQQWQDLQDFDEDMEELSSAEDFLEYFDIAFDQRVVHVNRLHILQRFHDYLSREENLNEQASSERYARHKLLLNKAYLDFVDSDAQAEKVLKIFKMNEPQTGFVSVEQLLGS